jgi:hypothetical protein
MLWFLVRQHFEELARNFQWVEIGLFPGQACRSSCSIRVFLPPTPGNRSGFGSNSIQEWFQSSKQRIIYQFWGTFDSVMFEKSCTVLCHGKVFLDKSCFSWILHLPVWRYREKEYVLFSVFPPGFWGLTVLVPVVPDPALHTSQL